jgi:hypothetical protein
MTMAATCTFCGREATLAGYLQPPLCDAHLAAAVVVAHLAARGLPATVQNARLVAARYPQPGLTADEVAELCRSMAVGEG